MNTHIYFDRGWMPDWLCTNCWMSQAWALLWTRLWMMSALPGAFNPICYSWTLKVQSTSKETLSVRLCWTEQSNMGEWTPRFTVDSQHKQIIGMRRCNTDNMRHWKGGSADLCLSSVSMAECCTGSVIQEAEWSGSRPIYSTRPSSDTYSKSS
jgi:hypothetical protein